MGGENGELLSNGDSGSVWENEKALEMGSVEGYTTIGMN